MQGLAGKQQVSVGQVLSTALYYSPLNHDSKRIFFTEASGLSPGAVRVLSKTGAPGTREPMDLPLGKLFFDGGKVRAAASEQNDLHHITYSLYGDGHAFDPRYAGQIVTDQRAGKTVALDAANSWLEGHVLVNGENYDIAHSSPILDEQGSVYYFRQNGNERILYKDRQPVFKYDGFYGKLMEVGADGGIYFIANTDYGSSLYEYKDKEITRVLNSDVVVDARLMDENRFVAIEVTPTGHRAVLTSANRHAATPATYSYGFPSYNLLPGKVPATEQVNADERPYNSFSQLRYSGMDFSASYDSSNGLSGLINGNFSDPMQYQAMNLGFFGGTNASQAFVTGYSFTKYLPQFGASYVYEKELWHQKYDVARKSFNQEVALGMTLPLLRWQRWDASWNLKALYSHKEPHIEYLNSPSKSVYEETYGSFNTVTLQYAENPDPAVAYFPWRAFTLNYQNKLESLPGAWKKKYNTSLIQAQYQHGFPLQFFASLSGNFAWAENHDIDLEYNTMPLTTDIRIPRIVPHDYYTAKTAGAARFEFEKVFDTPGYSARIPVSIERVAPLLVAQGIFLDRDGRGYGDYPESIFEWGFGADLQLLLMHLGSAKLRVFKRF